MALIKCPDCGKEFSDQAAACPNCGRPNKTVEQSAEHPQAQPQPQPPKEEKPKNTKLSIAALIVVILGTISTTAALVWLGIILGVIDFFIHRGKRKFAVLVTAFVISVFGIIFCSVSNFSEQEQTEPAVISESEAAPVDASIPEEPESTLAEETESEEDGRVNVGETIDVDGLLITFIAAEPYESDNQFIAPNDGNEFWKFEFLFENTSDSDKSVSSMMDWEGYADNTKIDQTWIGDESGLDATLSPGRNTQGSIYFEVPVNVENIEIEYEANMWSGEKVIFVAK